ncbi:MAG: hypothetical protein F4010_05880 [Cenarchaeum sp. SB0669_bin_11]|nr:hypothetical protein [Cenarchaeum sp. SB0669_bin_11]
MMLPVWPVQRVIFRFRLPIAPVGGPMVSGVQHGTDDRHRMPKAVIRQGLESYGPLRRITPARIVDGKTAALQAQ